MIFNESIFFFQYVFILPSAELKCCLLVNCKHSSATEQTVQTNNWKTARSMQHMANLNS